MVLWFNDAIFNLKCKTKGNWERAEFQSSHELFRKTRNGVLGLFPFHPFPMDENFIWVFRWFWSWGLQERRFEPVDQFWRTKVRAPTSKKNIYWSVLSSFFLVTVFLFKVFQGSCFCLKAWLPASSDDDRNVFLNAARMRLQRGNEKTKAIE